MATTPRVLIADDHPDILYSLERRLRKKGYAVLKPVTVLSQLRGEIRRHKPDIAIIDVYFGRENSLLQLRKFRAACPQTKFVVYTGADDPALARCAIAAGASGYLLKLHPEELFACVESVVSGHEYLATTLRRVERDRMPPTVFATLTSKQQNLYRLLHSGMKQAEIARSLGISIRTCERHATALSRALGLDRRGSYHIAWQEVATEPPSPSATDASDRDWMADWVADASRMRRSADG